MKSLLCKNVAFGNIKINDSKHMILSLSVHIARLKDATYLSTPRNSFSGGLFPTRQTGQMSGHSRNASPLTPVVN